MSVRKSKTFIEMKVSPHTQFDEEVLSRYDSLVNSYIAKIDKASNEDYKERTHNKILNDLRDEYRAIESTLKEFNQFISNIKDECGEDKDKKFETVFYEKFELLNSEGKQIVLTKLTQLAAINKMFGYLATESLKFRKSLYLGSELDTTGLNSEARTNLQWTGKSELEFVQLIYALHEARYLENDQDEITALVKQVAAAFNYKLGRNWQSNHSESINQRNADYESKVFEKLAKAYGRYRERLLNKGN